MGLPQAQAEKSAATEVAELPTTVTGGLNKQADGRFPTTCCAVLKIKEGADMQALKSAFAEYRANSAAAKGCVHCAYAIHDGECYFIEIYNVSCNHDTRLRGKISHTFRFVSRRARFFRVPPPWMRTLGTASLTTRRWSPTAR